MININLANNDKASTERVEEHKGEEKIDRWYVGESLGNGSFGDVKFNG